MKGCLAVLAALLFAAPPFAKAADDVSGAVRELAGRTASFLGAGQPVSITWRNLSSVPPATVAEAKPAFETAIRRAGLRVAEADAPAEIRMTFSENGAEFLLVGEARKGDERQVWIASWRRRSAPVPQPVSSISLDRKVVWEQEEPILDLAVSSTAMLVLSPARLTLYSNEGGGWIPHGSLELAPPRPWPRDLRGRLRLEGAAFQAFLPGLTCKGTIAPAISMECRPGDDPWPLDGGNRTGAHFAATRNYFDGRIAGSGNGARTVPPFYSAAPMEAAGHPGWVLAQLDGRARLFDGDWRSLCAPGSACEEGIAGWGSDIAGTSAKCGNGRQILATRAGDSADSDALQAFAIGDRAPAPIASPMAFPGPITALWPLGAESVLTVVRSADGHRYTAYVVTVACGS